MTLVGGILCWIEEKFDLQFFLVQELMGRPLRLKFSERKVSEKNANETENQNEEEVVSEGQTEES